MAQLQLSPPDLALLHPSVPLFVAVSPIHVCTPMPICGSVCAHGHVPAWLQAIPLSSAIPSWASIGAGRAGGLEQGSGSSGQLPPWQLRRKSSCLAATSPWWCGGLGKLVPLSHGCSSPVHPQALGQASCPWLPACGGCASSAHPL